MWKPLALFATLIIGTSAYFAYIAPDTQQFAVDTRSPQEKYGGSKTKARLTALQFDVTQKNGTEPAFRNEYWNHHEAGIYVDIVSGEPLFSSTDKYDSGTGWPSFTKPLVPENIVEKEDNSLGERRIEVRSKYADSHLGHVFPDGPEPAGLRYCINSAALRFVPANALQEEGYAEFEYLFAKD